MAFVGMSEHHDALQALGVMADRLPLSVPAPQGANNAVRRYTVSRVVAIFEKHGLPASFSKVHGSPVSLAIVETLAAAGFAAALDVTASSMERMIGQSKKDARERYLPRLKLMGGAEVVPAAGRPNDDTLRALLCEGSTPK